MKRKNIVRVLFILFIFLVGYLVGAGIGKSIRALSGSQAQLNILKADSFNNC